MPSDAERIWASYRLDWRLLPPDAIRNEAVKLRGALAELRSYASRARRARLRRRVLALIYGASPTAPFELIALVADVLGIAEGEPPPTALRYGRKKGDEFISAIGYEKRHREQHGRPASCNRVAEAVGVDWSTIRKWRKHPEYQTIAFGGEPLA